MAKEQRLNEQPIESIPEVRDFEEVKQRYNAFRQSNPAFFKFLDALTEEYNQKAEAAEKVVRARGITCGDFQRYQEVPKYNVEKLVDAIGVDAFKKIGGTVERVTNTVHKIDKKQIEAAVARNDIAADVVESVKSIEAKYHVPTKVVVP